MIYRYELKEVAWIDIENPTSDEVHEVLRETSLPPHLLEEILSPTEKPRVEATKDWLYAVFHFPSARHTKERESVREIDVLLSKKYLVTVHYHPVEAIDDLRRSFEAETLKNSERKVSADYLFFELMNRLYRGSDDELSAIESNIISVENRIFGGEEKNMVFAISKIDRELLVHRRVLEGHKEIISTLEYLGTNIFPPTFSSYLRGVRSFHARAHARALTLADMLRELRETNMALLTTRQNEIMKNLTIMTFVAFPLSVIAGIFGMNTIDTPLVQEPHSFFIIVGGMALLTLSLFFYFKIKRWI